MLATELTHQKPDHACDQISEASCSWESNEHFLSSSSSSVSSSSSQDRLIGPLPAKCWPEAFHATFIHDIERKVDRMDGAEA